jgi:broad specificity phosphatase PhoE
MTTFWLIRHGQTNWNAEGRWQGQSPLAPGLNDTGIAQAHATAAQLTQLCNSGVKFNMLYASDLLRAQQTAQIVAAALELPIYTDSRLREINQGDWEGLTNDVIAPRWVNEWEWRNRDPLNMQRPNGESVAMVAARMTFALEDLATRHNGQDVIIVSHGLALATVICRVRGIYLGDARHHIPNNAEVVKIDY